MGLSYTAFYVLTFFALTAVTIFVDFISMRVLKKHFNKVISEKPIFLYVMVFKTLAEVALLWLIVAFIGQIWMGWIQI